MEAERRSTMSSLKGQLSNVEGSVKSMKVAVVVGSVLTVACLAAVFGVTVLANEVSKEVKVSNGTLTSKSGETVMTTNYEASQVYDANTETVVLENVGSFKVNAVVVKEGTTTVICDDVVVFQKDGERQFNYLKDSIVATVLGENVEVSKRSLDCPACAMACMLPALAVACAWAAWGAAWAIKAILSYIAVTTMVGLADAAGIETGFSMK